MTMAYRKQWRAELDHELAVWSKKTPKQLILELPETKAYQVNVGNSTYQVEVDLLENTESYLHVGVGVDDGRLPASMFPVTDSFILSKREDLP